MVLHGTGNIKSICLPRAYNLTIPTEKLEMYSLNPNHLIGFHKAKMWKLYLGLTTNDINFIICEIRRLVPLYVAKQVTDSGYGMRYEVYIEMNGKEDKTAVVFTAWIDCITKNETRLLTAFPKPGKEALLI